MNLAQPEGQEDEDGGEGGDGDMEPPLPDAAVTTAVAGELRGKEAVVEPVLVGSPCLLEEEEEEEGLEEGTSGQRSWGQGLSPELQQGYRILSEFLLEKHRSLTAPFLRPLGGQEAEDGQSGGAASIQESSGPQQLSGMWLLKMDEKFSTGQYKGIAEFVSDFRLMLETCYRLHGVDHWLSKQAQKLEMMLEQKLALLSRHLREKTAIAVTSKGFYGLEDEKGTACTSTRRRSTPRSLAGLTTGVFESIMVQVLRQEEQLRAKEEKRLREQERKEAEEASQKEIEEWEKSLLAQAAPIRMENMWEIPAIGHFLCLAQHILNLPEIIFYELERCLLMPQCSAFLSKIMTSLLCPSHRRSTLHRRPTLPYRTWEAALRQKVQQWYTAVGQTDNPDSCAEKLGLCPQFFKVLGDVSPLEEKPFHELLFCQKVWLLKGLCDFVYETQKDVQDAVLGQPIHECREVILGYDYLENAYVHFPQFCGADVRIYKQKPFHAPEFPAPPIKVKKVPRIKLERAKGEYVAKSNGEVRLSPKEELLPPYPKAEPGKIHLDHLNVAPEKEEEEEKFNCEEKIHTDCNFTTDCYKANRDKVIAPGETVGFGAPLSPGEIRVLENGGKCGESSTVKTDTTPLKENTLKTCQVHVNGNHSDNPDMNCHRVAREVHSEGSVRKKTLKLGKMRVKKKKKKKKKLKDILNENLQRKREIHLHSLKSYKPEIQNKLFMMKKKAKHKKHKSGKKSISKKAITKKRKSVMKPAVPEFQLICTNLDELRELIRKIENELKDVENIKKKSGRWYHRKQAVKELHCTLIRLLNELLPWEPKLMKAFQRNRSRLKKDYDDFNRQPDHDTFIREQWTNEDGEINTGKEISSSLVSESEHAEFLKRDYADADIRLSEMDLAAGKARPLKKELMCKEIQKTLPKSVKRLSKQNSYLDDSTKECSPRKKLKLSTSDTTVHGIENDLSIDGCLNKLKQIECSSSQSMDVTNSATSISGLVKGTKPIQALLAKNIGNKVTLTSQLPPTAGRSISASEKLMMSTMGSSPIKPVLPCQTGSKSPLQVLYKMPGGHCVPIDLHNNSVKIQMQPVVDGKPGEKTMQQVLILPKNFLIHHRENKSVAKEIQPLLQKTTEQHCISLPQPTSVNTTLAPAFPTSTINAATAFLPSTNFKKNTTCLPQAANATNRLPTLPSIAPTGNVLASVVKMSQSETAKTKTMVSAATFPVASATVSSAVQTLTTTLPQSVSACTSSSSPKLASPQTSSDIGEPKQELKTICIRDSQSILVRTRGGNTGIVKVQANSEQVSPNNLLPSSVFTYAPQLQAFLVPKSTQLPTSNFPSVTTAIPNFPTLVQSPPTTSTSIPTVSASVNQVMGKNMTLAYGQPHNSSTVGHGMQKTVHASSPTFLSSLSSSNIVMPALPNTSTNTMSISPGNIGQSTMGTAQTPFINQQMDINNTKFPATQHETTATPSGSVMSGAQIPKLMLVTNPSLLPACGTAGVNLIPAPTSTGINTQKLVFINTPLANIQSNTSITAESFKQTFPTSMGKPCVKSTEQPQLVLIPSTVGASIKVNTSPTVSQIKDVKIGLNIGQAIINSTGNAQSVPSINIMQSAASKDAEENPNQSVILPLSTSSSLVPVCSSLASQTVVTRPSTMSSVTTTNACLDSASIALSGTTAATRPTVLAGGIDDSTKVAPVLTARQRISTVGNTVAISTVKTGHLASSVLISATQPTVSHPSLSSAFQLPVTVALPGPVNGTPKMIHTVPQLPAAPGAAKGMPLSKGQQSTLLQFQSPGISTTVPTNGSAQKPQTVFPPNASNAGKVISFSNFVPLPCQPMPPNLVKPTPAFTCAPSASTTPTVPVPPSVMSNVGGQLNESCVQHKIIINTCTPLAPGTQIMISGTRFIVPPQGLGAGSHVLLISSNPKLGPLLSVSNGYGFQRMSHTTAAPQKTAQVSSNTLSWQPSKQPLKSSTKIVNSLGTANTLPIVHATPQIVNSATKPCTSPSATLSTSLVAKTPSSTLVNTSLVSTTHSTNSQLQSSASVLQLDTSIKKLMVSPEGAILNAINTPTSKTSNLPSSFSPDIVSTTTNPAVVFPNFLKSSIGVPDTAAS
ncbi:uncharacterized protein KIAA2026 homolog isoform X2 [Hemicordylus capensis]|uniref:uncharacterized protein KIAA2026 homolog isoform X2 n=1 Tax=Hemicordylus capensis TaxID=884348 RepID=UPI0023040699|nr:uncharacterized protein KIAA2026 homolog isoform X2 [Hemicordylus capensis]